MTKFFLGFAAVVVVVLAAAFCFVRFGFIDPRADIPVNSLESAIVCHLSTPQSIIGRLTHGTRPSYRREPRRTVQAVMAT